MQESNVILREAPTGTANNTTTTNKTVIEPLYEELDLAKICGIGPLNKSNQLLANKVVACFNKTNDGKFANIIKYYLTPTNGQIIYDNNPNSSKKITKLDSNIALMISKETGRNISGDYKWVASKELLNALNSVTLANVNSVKTKVASYVKLYKSSEATDVAEGDKATSKEGAIISTGFTQKQTVLAQRAIENAVKPIKYIDGYKVLKTTIVPVTIKDTAKVTEARLSMSNKEIQGDVDTGKQELFFKINMYLQQKVVKQIESFQYIDFLKRYFEAEGKDLTNLKDRKVSEFLENHKLVDNLIGGLVGAIVNKKSTEFSGIRFVERIRDVYNNLPKEGQKSITDALRRLCKEAFIQKLQEVQKEDAGKDYSLIIAMNVDEVNQIYKAVLDVALNGNHRDELEDVLKKAEEEASKKVDNQEIDTSSEETTSNTVTEGLALEQLEASLIAKQIPVMYGDYKYNFMFSIEQAPVLNNNIISTVIKVNKDAGKKSIGKAIGKALATVAGAAVGGALSAANDFQQGKKSNIY